MTTRVSGKAAGPVVDWIDLPSLFHPQYVNEEDYEFSEPPDDQDDGEDAEMVEDEAVAADTNGTMVDADAEVVEAVDDEMDDTAVEEEQVDDPKEPVLSIAESHPPIPSHNKPRARPGPRSTFAYPTPPPPLVPLPYPEYHGPHGKGTGSREASTGAATTVADAPDAEAGPSAAKASKAAKRAALMDEAYPAHETECIARVTFSVGPFSYPETELWLGRFVPPRLVGEKLKVLRNTVRKEKQPGQPTKRARKSNPTANLPPGEHLRRSLPSGRPPLMTPGPATTITQAPDTSAPGALSAQGQGARPPGANAAHTINPQLIQRVNATAAHHPWLSAIIHKAARTQATKEELAKLGRVVARLSKGEPINSEDDVAAPAPAVVLGGVPRVVAIPGSSTNAQRPPPPRPSTSRTSATSSLSGLNEDDDDESELSDAEVEADMKGPKQVGGGSLEGGGDLAGNPPANGPDVKAGPSTSIAAPTSPRIPTPFTHFVPSPVVPIPRPPRPLPLPFTATPMKVPFQFPAVPPISSKPTPEGSASRSLAAPIPIQPPKPSYPRTPPFLFIAFKENPSEKYLLPLGSNSFISRVGGDYVTHAPPPPVSAPSGPSAPPGSLQSPEPVATSKSNSAQPNTVLSEPTRGRTRASLGRHAKDVPPPKPLPEVKKEPTPRPVVEEEEEAIPKPPPSSGLPPLAGTKPSEGTVLVSTLIPGSGWEKPEWSELEKGLPWINPALLDSDRLPSATSFVPSIANEKPNVEKLQTSLPGSLKPVSEGETIKHGSVPPSPTRSRRQPSKTVEAPVIPRVKKPRLMNLGGHDLLPGEGDIHAVTIRLGDVDDKVWARVKSVMRIVEEAEMIALGEDERDLHQVPGDEESKEGGIPIGEQTLILAASQPAPAPQRVNAVSTAVRESYYTRKKSRFSERLSRVPPRIFLRLRTEQVEPALIEATTDKWAARPYPISTKALYNISPPPDDAAVPVVLEPPLPTAKKRKGEQESTVTFEMPVSLDALDEKVAEGAKFALGRKRGKYKKRKSGDGEASGSGRLEREQKDATETAESGARKRYGKRWKAGVLCEGCGLEGLKVWRRGPNGKVCNACGDMYLAGELGELKAPGAASIGGDVAEDINDVKQEGDVGGADSVVEEARDSVGAVHSTDVPAKDASDASHTPSRPEAPHDPAAPFNPELKEANSLPMTADEQNER